ncbi:amidohydrolase family protein [bacterium]|nr:amidohydrolase family protein [bacterium]
MNAIDVHTHAFPDILAERAIAALSEAANLPILMSGTIGALLESMDAAGVAQSWVCSIATRPDQFRSILEWSSLIASDRILPFGSVHPTDPEAVEHVKEIHARGLRGMKFHPYYQEFDIDEPRMDPVYAAAEQLGLIILFHAGFDPGFPRVRRAAPERIRRVIERFPRLKVIAAHLVGWLDWDAVDRELIGRPLFLDVSSSIPFLGVDRARALIEAHGPERILFGSDSPWSTQAETIAQVKSLGFDETIQNGIMFANAKRVLNSGSEFKL